MERVLSDLIRSDPFTFLHAIAKINLGQIISPVKLWLRVHVGILAIVEKQKDLIVILHRLAKCFLYKYDEPSSPLGALRVQKEKSTTCCVAFL